MDTNKETRPVTHMVIEQPDSRPVREVKRYNPSRDLAYCHSAMVNKVLQLAAKENGGHADFVASGLMSPSGEPDLAVGDLGEAGDSLIDYLNKAGDPDCVDSFTTLTDSGWFKARPQSRVVLMSLLGMQVLQTSYYSRRDTFDPEGVNSRHLSLDELKDSLDRLHRISTMNPLKRRMVIRWNKILRPVLLRVRKLLMSS